MLLALHTSRPTQRQSSYVHCCADSHTTCPRLHPQLWLYNVPLPLPSCCPSSLLNSSPSAGTGALRVGAEFLSNHLPASFPRIVYLPRPTWGNHKSIFAKAGFQVGIQLCAVSAACDSGFFLCVGK